MKTTVQQRKTWLTAFILIFFTGNVIAQNHSIYHEEWIDFNKNGIKVRYPFGYGLSYTSFEYSDMKASNSVLSDSIQFRFRLTNVGNYNGAETIQVYIHPEHPKVDRPVRELKFFRKVRLFAGQSEEISFSLDKSSFAFYDTESHDWNTEPGDYTIQVGSSSEDIRLNKKVNLK